MKKLIATALLVLTAAIGFVFAETRTPYDELVEKLTRNIDPYEELNVGVKLFESEVNKRVTTQISKAVQMALYESGTVNIVESKDEADLICIGKISDRNERYYQVKVSLLDAGTGEILYTAKKNIDKVYAEAGLPEAKPEEPEKKAPKKDTVKEPKKETAKGSSNEEKSKSTTVVIKEDRIDAMDVVGAVIIADWFFDILDWTTPHHRVPKKPRPPKKPKAPKKAPAPKAPKPPKK